MKISDADKSHVNQAASSLKHSRGKHQKRALGAIALCSLLLSIALGACSNSVNSSSTSASISGMGDTSGLVSPSWWKARQIGYLKYVNSSPLDPTNVYSIIDHIAWSKLGHSSAWNPQDVTVADFAPTFAHIKAEDDTTDFDVNLLLFLWTNYHSSLSPQVQSAIQEALLSFKYWYTEPTPSGITDNQDFWTENHQIIYFSDQYIAGQTFENSIFSIDGKTGKVHMQEAASLINQWMNLRAHYGFSEWLSDPYYTEDLMGLLLLADHANDMTIARKAEMLLDILFFDMAINSHDNILASTHGRSYAQKDTNGNQESTTSIEQLILEKGTPNYQSLEQSALLAVSNRYRPPEVLRKIANDPRTITVNEQAGIPLNAVAPINSANKVAPYGLSFTNPNDLIDWWGMGAQLTWQVGPLSLATINKYNLWSNATFSPAIPFKSVIENDNASQLQKLALSVANEIDSPLLSQAAWTTWRSSDVSLSSVQNWRVGQRAGQVHVWQASINPNAEVYTNSPSIPLSNDEFDSGGAYWAGEAYSPSSGQDKNVGIFMYSPGYTPIPSLGTYFNYPGFTHAYFPTQYFDQVVQSGNWTIGRSGSGYIALWSWRTPTWRTTPSTSTSQPMTGPFDLQALGGPDNVWITEVGSASQWQSKAGTGGNPFNAFVSAIESSNPQVTPLESNHVPCPSTPTICTGHQPSDGFNVSYNSPTIGQISFGTYSPFKVNNSQLNLTPGDRYNTPFAVVPFGSQDYNIQDGGWSLDLNFNNSSLTSSGPK